MKAYPELAAALSEMLDRLDASLRAGGAGSERITMYLAGGLAVNFHCGTRYTEDVDASFSHRFLLPKDLTIEYQQKTGSKSFIYFDRNYNDTFALMPEHYRANAQEWPNIGNEKRIIQLHVLSPLDLAVSKIARFSDQDRADILALAAERYFTAAQLGSHATDALSNFIGDKRPVRQSIDLICREIEAASRK